MKNQLESYIQKNLEHNLLSKRLATIASYVRNEAVLADIGTDHAYIPIALAKAGIIKRAYAMDVNQGPIEKAEANIRAFNVQDIIETVLSNGLENLEDQTVDHILIAGMGGILISDILIKHQEKLQFVERLIISPHRDVSQVRKTVHKLGFKIIHEDMVEDGQYYPIIICEHGEEHYDNPIDYLYGKVLLDQKPDVFVRFIKIKCEKIETILKQLENNDSCVILERKAALTKEYDILREVIDHDKGSGYC